MLIEPPFFEVKQRLLAEVGDARLLRAVWPAPLSRGATAGSPVVMRPIYLLRRRARPAIAEFVRSAAFAVAGAFGFVRAVARPGVLRRFPCPQRRRGSRRSKFFALWSWRWLWWRPWPLKFALRLRQARWRWKS